ncbi:MAG: mechanosensitive ion channel family protein [Sulfurovum sp.]
MLKALKSQEYLENVVNTFSASLVTNSSNIYITSRISGSKFLHLLNRFNTTSFGLEANRYLSVLGLNLAKLVLIVLVITFIYFFNRIIDYIINRVLLHFKIRQEDIDYINSRITKLFNVITSILIIHIILLATMDISTKGFNINTLFGIIYVVLVSMLFYRIGNTVIAMRTEQIKKSKVLKNEVVNLVVKVHNTLIILIALIVILRIFGVDLTALLSGLGIAGAAVAFAAKDSIANIFGSVSILAGEVFRQGDWIETKEVNGTVVEIGLRATTIRTFDNALISIPNSELANFSVKNWSRRSIGRIIKMNIGVTYQSNFDDIRSAITQIRTMLKTHPDIANQDTSYLGTYRESRLVSVEDFKGVKRSTLVYMDAFEDSSITILIECFSRSVDREEWLKTKEDILFKIADILAKNHLDFAYPSLAVYSGDPATISLI